MVAPSGHDRSRRRRCDTRTLEPRRLALVQLVRSERPRSRVVRVLPPLPSVLRAGYLVSSTGQRWPVSGIKVPMWAWWCHEPAITCRFLAPIHGCATQGRPGVVRHGFRPFSTANDSTRQGCQRKLGSHRERTCVVAGAAAAGRAMIGASSLSSSRGRVLTVGHAGPVRSLRWAPAPEPSVDLTEKPCVVTMRGR